MANKTMIKKDENSPEPMEVIAASIIEVSNGFKKINESKLERRVILLLIKDITGLPITEISKILDAACNLEKIYIKKNDKSNSK